MNNKTDELLQLVLECLIDEYSISKDYSYYSSFVYVIWNPEIERRLYIGSTNNIHKRMKRHHILEHFPSSEIYVIPLRVYTLARRIEYLMMTYYRPLYNKQTSKEQKGLDWPNIKSPAPAHAIR